MRRDIEALYQAVARVEAHTATTNRLLDTLRAGYRNARGNTELRRKLEGEIAYYTRQLGALHAERDQLRRQIKELRSTPADRMRRDFKKWARDTDESEEL